MDNTILYWFLLTAAGMMLVAIAAIVYWRRLTHLPYRWFWLGAGLWFVAVAVKVVLAILTHEAVVAYLKERLSYYALLTLGGLYGGLLSSVCEIGLTLLAVLLWRQLGRDADRAIGIGVGAGAFEAFLLGCGMLVGALAAMAGIEGTAPLRQELEHSATSTPVVWLAPIAERIMAILCHACTRALVILGVVHRRPWMVVWGFVIFTYIDAVATAAQLSGKLGSMSVWWIELAILPAALVSISILRWCFAKWASANAPEVQPTAGAIPAV
ncbi:MAG: YhfC family intramembrane metalloprotease [Planctomycetes bacterium]|nr:YhfC family intramembrane metalloprotease [Planctomycetota bacterium]